MKILLILLILLILFCLVIGVWFLKENPEGMKIKDCLENGVTCSDSGNIILSTGFPFVMFAPDSCYCNKSHIEQSKTKPKVTYRRID